MGGAVRQVQHAVGDPPRRAVGGDHAEAGAELGRRAVGGDLDAEGAKALVRELKAVGADLKALRLVLTGSERGPELWAILVALPREGPGVVGDPRCPPARGIA